MCVCICVCLCMSICVHLYCACMWICFYIYICACICVSLCVCVCVYTSVCGSVCLYVYFCVLLCEHLVCVFLHECRDQNTISDLGLWLEAGFHLLLLLLSSTFTRLVPCHLLGIFLFCLWPCYMITYISDVACTSCLFLW